jgi:hypothetical protein
MTNFLRVALSSLFLLVFPVTHVFAERITGAAELDEILLFFIDNDYLEAIENTDNRMAAAFCERFNSTRPSVCRVGAITGSYSSLRELSLAEGICLAANGQRPSICRVSSITGSYSTLRDLSLAEGICLAGNGRRPSVCRVNSITGSHSSLRELSLAEGICLAGNGQRPSVCRVGAITGSYASLRTLSLAEGICLAGNGQRPSVCQNRRHSFQEFTIRDALLSLPSDDRLWAWDSFRNQYGTLVWACRGVQTGQFSFLVRCHDRPRHDLTWPG